MSDNSSGIIRELFTSMTAKDKASIAKYIFLLLVVVYIGVDVARPINTVTNAWANSIEMQAKGMEEVHIAVKRTELLYNDHKKTSLDLHDQQLKMASRISREMTSALVKNTAAINGLNDSVTGMKRQLVALQTRVEVLERDSRPRE